MNKLLLRISFGLLLLGNMPTVSAAEMVYIYHLPESKNDHRYDYHWEVLKLALEKTSDRYGPYVMKPADSVMTEARQLEEIKNATGKLTVLIKAANREYEQALTPVRIPLDKGLIGYRVFLINRKDQPKFAAISTLEELKKLTVGQGAGWADVEVWKANGFQVMTGGNYDGLFSMVVSGRFDFFSRGMVEVIEEFDQRKDKMPDLHIEETICVYYPWPFYFYFPKTEEGKALAARVEEGLLQVFKDGSLEPIFLKYHGEALARFHLKDRKIFRLRNPLLSPETPLDNPLLWYDPIEKAPK